MSILRKIAWMGMMVMLWGSLQVLSGASKPDLKMVKTHHVRNLDKKRTGGNEALEYEHRYWDYGAASHKELQGRRGEIFVFVWRNDGAPITGEAVFSYRQERTQDAVKTIRLPINAAKGTQRSVVSVAGEDYFRGGRLYSWLFEIKSTDGRMHLKKNSFIW
jgi:hypothetical protein